MSGNVVSIEEQKQWEKRVKGLQFSEDGRTFRYQPPRKYIVRDYTLMQYVKGTMIYLCCMLFCVGVFAGVYFLMKAVLSHFGVL